MDWRHYLVLSLIAGIFTSVAAVKMRRRVALGPLGRFAFFEHIVLPALLLSMAAFIFSVGLFVDTGGVDVNESMVNMISAIIFGASLLLLAIVVPLFFPLIFPFYVIGGFSLPWTFLSLVPVVALLSGMLGNLIGLTTSKMRKGR